LQARLSIIVGNRQHVFTPSNAAFFLCLLLLQLRRYPQLPRDVESLAALCAAPGRAQNMCTPLLLYGFVSCCCSCGAIRSCHAMWRFWQRCVQHQAGRKICALHCCFTVLFPAAAAAALPAALCAAPGRAHHVLTQSTAAFLLQMLLLQLRRYPQLPRDVHSLAALCAAPGRAQYVLTPLLLYHFCF
jgi:hypothetical protein